MLTAEGLPELCYSRLGEDDSCVILKRGESGYYATNYPPGYSDEIIDELNARMGVTRAQRLAMEIGSMCGWHVPGADPASHASRSLVTAPLPDGVEQDGADFFDAHGLLWTAPFKVADMDCEAAGRARAAFLRRL